MIILQLATSYCFLDLARSDTQDDINQFMTKMRPIVKTELGLVLTPDQILASSTDNILQSVFMKINRPKPPVAECNLDCVPDRDQIYAILNPPDGCWIENMVVPEASRLDVVKGVDKESCMIACLTNNLCEMMTYDPVKELCNLQTSGYYRLNAVNRELTSHTALLSCLLENHSTSRQALCGNGNPLFELVSNSMLDQHSHMIGSYLKRFKDLKAAYDLNLTEISQHRRRRDIWESLDFVEDIPLVGHFFAILRSPVDNRKVKEHLLDLQHRFSSFAEEVAEQISITRQFQGNVLQIVEEGLGQLNQYITGLRCDIASLATLMVYQQALHRHQLKIAEMFFAVSHGRLFAEAAQTLTINDLELIVKNNPNFKDTIYSTNPEILYRVADLVLAQVTKGSRDLVFHFLLIAPKLAPASLYQTYKVLQVPIVEQKHSQTCHMIAIPNTIFLKQATFYTTNIADCTERSEMILCQQDFSDLFSPNVQEAGCLNGRVEQCTTRVVPCNNQMTFTRGGALVFSRSDVLGMARNETSRLTVLSTEGTATYFLPWKKYKLVQTGHDIMYALDHSMTVRNLSWSGPEEKIDLKSYLAARSLEQSRKNISLLRELLDNTTRIALLDYEPNFIGSGTTKKRFFEICSYTSWILTLLSTLVIVLACCYRRVQKQNQMMKTVVDSIRHEKERRRLMRNNLYDSLDPVPMPRMLAMERLPVEMADIPATSVLRRAQHPTSTIRRDNPEKPVRIRESGSRANPPQVFLGDRESEEGRRPREEENRTGYTPTWLLRPREKTGLS